MRTEGQVKDTFTTISRRRRTLSNITNLSLSASWASDGKEVLTAKSSTKGISFAESQLREENTALKRLISEKDVNLQRQAAQMDQMQREFLLQLRRQGQVNEELISYNSRLSKDSGQLRDQLKLLQHEYCQMTVAYRVNQSELQVKLAESQELLTRLLAQTDISSNDQSISTKSINKPTSSSGRRRHSTANIVVEEECGVTTKTGNSREKEDSVKRSDFTSGSRQTQQQPIKAAPSRSPNLYCDLIGLDPMPEESCEDDDCSVAPSTSEEASSSVSDEFCRSGNSGSSSKSDSTSRRRKSSSSESTVCGKKASQVGNSRKPIQIACSPAPSPLPAPHFSRRVAISSSLITENGRPMRRAVVKVASYAEPSLKTKIRRPQ